MPARRLALHQLYGPPAPKVQVHPHSFPNVKQPSGARAFFVFSRTVARAAWTPPHAPASAQGGTHAVTVRLRMELQSITPSSCGTLTLLTMPAPPALGSPTIMSPASAVAHTAPNSPTLAAERTV